MLINLWEVNQSQTNYRWKKNSEDLIFIENFRKLLLLLNNKRTWSWGESAPPPIVWFNLMIYFNFIMISLNDYTVQAVIIPIKER